LSALTGTMGQPCAWYSAAAVARSLALIVASRGRGPATCVGPGDVSGRSPPRGRSRWRAAQGMRGK
jgi:hypothetical protein